MRTRYDIYLFVVCLSSVQLLHVVCWNVVSGAAAKQASLDRMKAAQGGLNFASATPADSADPHRIHDAIMNLLIAKPGLSISTLDLPEFRTLINTAMAVGGGGKSKVEYHHMSHDAVWKKVTTLNDEGVRKVRLSIRSGCNRRALCFRGIIIFGCCSDSGD